MTSHPTACPNSTETRLVREIAHLEQLIEKISAADAVDSGDSWYLSMLMQSLARKIAALDYIRGQDQEPRTLDLSLRASAGRH